MQLFVGVSFLAVGVSSLGGPKLTLLRERSLAQARAGPRSTSKGFLRMATSIPQGVIVLEGVKTQLVAEWRVMDRKERPELSIPSPDDESGVHLGHQSWGKQHVLPPGALPLDPERSSMPGGEHMADTASHLESTAPELLPLWARHGQQLPEELVHDVNLRGILARVEFCEVLDHASLREACREAMFGFPEEAAGTLECLLCLQLKLSYLSTKTPKALKEYTNTRDAGGITRRAEAALLAHISSEHSFPRGEKSAAAVLPLLAEHLKLNIPKEDPKTWEAIEAVFERAHPWAVRTECLLVEGCDDRITVPYDAGRTTNKYHCSPVPTPEVVSRSSCTSSSSSRKTFGSADDMRHDLLISWALKKGVGRDKGRANSKHEPFDGGSFSDRMNDIRRRLLNVLNMDRNSVEVFLTPSGSDAEFLPTALAYSRARLLGHKAADGPAVTSIVVAAGEVGSGTADAAGGKHFSKLTPRGTCGHPQRHVNGFSAGDIAVIQMKTRSKSGAFLPCEELIRRAVHKALTSSPASVVVVHFVAGSKTGIYSPSEGLLAEMQERYGERILVVVDACQLRSEAEDLQRYLSLGFLTLITGSKFYCGPPFCGAVLYPRAALAELEAMAHDNLPAGFKDYFTRHEIDSRYPILRSCLPKWENRGLLLRWASALNNMEAIKSIPQKSLHSFIGSWVKEVRGSVQDKWPYLSPLPEEQTGEPCIAVGGVNTVVPIVVRVPRASEGPDGNPEVALGYDDLRLFHRLLSEDIAGLLRKDLDEGDRASASLRFLFGQPVKLGGASFGVIRIALGADMLMDAFCRGDSPLPEENVAAIASNEGLARLLTHDRLAMNKCTLMARHWHFLKEAATKDPLSVTRSKNGTCLDQLTTTRGMCDDDLRFLESLVAVHRRELPPA